MSEYDDDNSSDVSYGSVESQESKHNNYDTLSPTAKILVGLFLLILATLTIVACVKITQRTIPAPQPIPTVLPKPTQVSSGQTGAQGSSGQAPSGNPSNGGPQPVQIGAFSILPDRIDISSWRVPKKKTLNVLFYTGNYSPKFEGKVMSISEVHKHAQRRDPNQTKLSDNWAWGYGWLERCHSFIQWFFPITEGKGQGHGNQKLESIEKPFFKTKPEIIERMRKTIDIMFDFWGVEVDWNTNTVTRKDPRSYPKYFHPWENLWRNSHNNLRICRVIKHVSNLSKGIGYSEFQGLMKSFVALFKKEIDRGYFFQMGQKDNGTYNNLKRSLDQFWIKSLPRSEQSL